MEGNLEEGWKHNLELGTKIIGAGWLEKIPSRKRGILVCYSRVSQNALNNPKYSRKKKVRTVNNSQCGRGATALLHASAVYTLEEGGVGKIKTPSRGNNQVTSPGFHEINISGSNKCECYYWFGSCCPFVILITITSGTSIQLGTQNLVHKPILNGGILLRLLLW